jgi:hypothetical protein
MEKAVTLVMLQPPTPARESAAWTHVPSQPPVRSLLSQFRTPTVISQRRRFFRVRPSCGSPRWTGSPSLLWPATFSCQPFRPSTNAILIHRGQLSTPKVGAKCTLFSCGNLVVQFEQKRQVTPAVERSSATNSHVFHRILGTNQRLFRGTKFAA